MAKVRTVLVKVSPAPSTLSERRAILGVLKQHGDVEFFKRLQDPSHFVSILQSEDMANDLVARSPLQFDCVTEQRAPGSKAPSTTVPTTTFLVKITAKSDYKHKPRIAESPLHGRWPTQQSIFASGSPMSAALRDAVPRDMAWEGLADWDSCGQLDEDNPPAAKLVSNSDYTAARKERRERRRADWDSLMEAYNARHGGKSADKVGSDEKGAEA
ncbi:hypothetical protein NEMBOFW57_004965 [Staphylotrichum longicolle]|uniref:Uncharacterized protein n=1 Tax=Staphylotrichum longicolle TaxID=669026 RepID=A0AAD4EVT4_9PEZI|nr:hypothetical protein NEMBOFW57_004965 [Staphylotrichum longicolle]